MEESKREVKHITLAKFKEGVTEEEIEEFTRRFANLVDLIPSIKAFKWGKEMGIAKLDEGFTRVFEATFESGEGVAEYIANQHHIDFGNFAMPKLDKVIVVDVEPHKFQP